MASTTDTAHVSPARAQSLVLIGVGVTCALLAWLAHPGHEVALLALGLGLFAAHATWQKRFFIPAVVVTLYGATNVLWMYGAIPGGALYGAYVLDAAVASLVVTLAARRGYVGAHPLSPAVLLGLIGVLLLGTSSAPINATGFYTLFVSFWMPAIVLVALGLLTLTTNYSSQRQPQ